jgi:hypothetical protein
MSLLAQAGSRRQFLAGTIAAAGALAGGRFTAGGDPAGDTDRALVAITLDLEMSRNFPQWEQTQWDYEKGNLNQPTKEYTVEACRRVKVAGGVLHTFCVGRVLEQENVDWLAGIAAEGHPVGNHTYDHVNVTAQSLDEVQFRFRRAPWLVAGKTPAEVIAENIRLTTLALKQRAGIESAGFRTPGGFGEGLAGREDLQQMLLAQGFIWVSSKYPGHLIGEPGREPSAEVRQSILAAQPAAQPFSYPSGLIEVPMSPISDIGAFRSGRWKLDWFLEAIEAAVTWAIGERAVFDFLGHPSCLYVVDPEFKAVDLICRLVAESAGKAALVDLNAIAHAKSASP